MSLHDPIQVVERYLEVWVLQRFVDVDPTLWAERQALLQQIQGLDNRRIKCNLDQAKHLPAG